MSAEPSTEDHDDVVRSDVSFTGRDGATVAALLYCPRGAGPFPAVAIGAEATGVNRFIRRVGATLAHLGVVSLVIDPHRGDGPPDPEAYEDFETIIGFLDRLDFVRATNDLGDGVALLRSLDGVDPDRVAVWGYCTGATLALLTAVLDPRLAAAVLFYPSQPTFDQLGDRTPAHPMDLLWGIRCPTLFIYGDNDVVMPPERLAELGRRLELWRVDHELALYPGAGHAFCAEAPSLFHEQSANDSWRRATAYLLGRLDPQSGTSTDGSI